VIILGFARLPQRHEQRDVLSSQLTVAAGFVFAAFTLGFLMWQVSRFDQVQCSRAGLMVLVFGFGSALSTSFLGGYAAATGPVSIPYLGKSPINVALGGGILALVITTAMAWIVVGKNCVEIPDEWVLALEECKSSPPQAHRGCVRVKGLGAPPDREGALSVREGPGLICKKKNVLVNGDVGEVLATHKDWNYFKKLTGQAPVIEGWVSVSFIEATPCPGTP
jgi:hypothetical protein